MKAELTGYRGLALEKLRSADMTIGDVIRVTLNDQVFEGTLMPNSELSGESHIVIKLSNGYNLGIKTSLNMQVEKVRIGVKPVFTSPYVTGEQKKLPTVAIISTGGTIASRVDYRTGAVHPALSANDLLSVVPELYDLANIRTEILFSLLSENIYTPHWSSLSKAIAQYIIGGVDGVVVCHGTDTMAYTSAALSFALRNLPVPVILVGSQRSSDRPSSDASMNLIKAVEAAIRIPIAEVMICMHETVSDTSIILHRGTRARKLHTSRRDAFQSIGVSPIARIEGKKTAILTDSYYKRDKKRQMILKPDFDEKTTLIKFHPGLDHKIIEWYTSQDYRGIILEGTGLGHVAQSCFSAIKRAIDKKVFIGMCSQCLYGRVNMKVYDTGRDLLKIGVTQLEDMLPETAFVKLSWTLGQTKNLNEVKELMLTKIAEEFTLRSLYFERLQSGR
jgi:glutamyl-tRNA(Gln) amidotransferase subunit D